MDIVYIKAFVKCAKKMNASSRKQSKQDKKTWVSSAILCIILVTYVITLISVFAPHSLSPHMWSIMLLAEVIVSAVYFLQTYRKDPFEESSTLKLKSRALCRAFMIEMGISSSKLPIVREAVSQYCQDRRAARKTVTERVFAFCICGALIRCIPLFAEAYIDSSQAPALIYLSICIICIFAAPLAGTIWDICESFHSVSLRKAKSILTYIDCYELYK